MMLAYRWRLRSVVLAALLAVLAAVAGDLPACAQQAAPQAQPDQKPQPDGQPAAATAPQTQSAEKPALPSDVAENVSRLANAIETAEKTIQQLADLEEELGGLRVDVETILSDSAHTAETLRPELAAVRSQIEKLGPPPGKDAPAEAPALAAERARLNALAAALDGGIKSAELTWVRARQLIEKITVLRSSLFTRNLMERKPSPLLPGMWRDLFSKSPGIGGRITYLVDDWLHWASIKHTEVWLLVAAALILFAGLKIAARRLTDRRGARRQPPLPTFFERAMSVAWVAPVRAFPAIAAAVLLYGGLESLELLFAPWGVTAAATLKAIVLYAAVSALIFAVLAPRSPQWRLVSLADGPTRPVGALLCAITAVYAVDMALTDISRVFYMPLAMTVVQTFAASVAFSVLLIGLLLTPFTPLAAEPAAVVEAGNPEQPPHRAAYPRLTPVWLKLPLWVITLGILGLTGLGYVALARFIAQQLVMTGLVVVVTWLLYLAIRAITRDPQHRHNSVGELLEARFGLDAPRRNQLAWLTEVALTFALLIGALPFLMLQWGFSGAEIRDWFKSLFFGVEIGQFRISLARILIGIVLFIALLFATRLLQRWLRERALQQTRMDPGIVNSIDTVVGYVGIGLAALLAVSYAGLDITNLAIVAGALSVGIGFGLQSIVNNFVSGLILLVERPIRVGDRIVVGDQQGLVRRISVRATEIETFDRASLIVPNSELITGRVLNWTHRDSLGAVSVEVGVAYDADPEQVTAILKTCAEEHPQVLQTPPPLALFENFGDSALIFNLRVSLADIAAAGVVQSELRVAVLKALRAANIEIPFNQLDVSLRHLDGVGRYLEAYADKQAGKSAASASAPPGNGKTQARE